MSGLNSDRLHRSTLGIYSSLMDQLNPSLQKLVSLGNSYIQAFQALAATSEAYFNALAKIGEEAFHTMSSRSIGDVLIQISESQRTLTTELEGVFRWFHTEVVQEMDSNIRLDKDYISASRRRYEMEVRNQATALERQLRRGANQDVSEYLQFLRQSHGEALKEEERRYRFLAEKHCDLTQSMVHVMNKTKGLLQKKSEAWREDVEATRGPGPSRTSRPDNTGGGGGRGRSMRALVTHQPDTSNPTLLPFSKGEMISVLVSQSKNGWLYGRAGNNSRQGWFPATYVEAVDDTPKPIRSSSSLSNLLDQSGGPGNAGVPPPPPPPPPSSLSSNKQSEMRPVTPSLDRRAESYSDRKRPEERGAQPALFPKGTNPFATVKLKPTSTNDRSAPHLYR
ncbi:BAR/IMD domain-containing adapter protein 2-like 2 [Polymixia lowei]